MKKNDTDMSTTKSNTSLTVHYSDLPVIDEDGNALVIACGYAVNNKFGYFICKEKHVVSVDLKKEYFEYSDVIAFYPKVSNQTYQQVVKEYEKHVSTV